MRKLLLRLVGVILLALGLVFLLGAIADEHHIFFGILAAVFLIGAYTFFTTAKTPKQATPRTPTQAEEPRKQAAAAAKAAELERLAEDRRRREAEFETALDAIPVAEIPVSDAPAKHHTLSEMPDYNYSNVTKRTSRDKLGDFVSIDIETTGLAPARDEIVEVAAVRFRGFVPVEKFTTLCAARKGVKAEAAQVNGITEELLEGKPPFDMIAEGLRTFLGGDNIVGQNLEFDIRFLWRHGLDPFDPPRRFYDTLDLAERTLKRQKYVYDKEYGMRLPDYETAYDVPDYKLGTLCAYYSIPFFEGHRALADAYVTGQLFQALAADRE